MNACVNGRKNHPTGSRQWRTGSREGEKRTYRYFSRDDGAVGLAQVVLDHVEHGREVQQDGLPADAEHVGGGAVVHRLRDGDGDFGRDVSNHHRGKAGYGHGKKEHSYYRHTNALIHCTCNARKTTRNSTITLTITITPNHHPNHHNHPNHHCNLHHHLNLTNVTLITALTLITTLTTTITLTLTITPNNHHHHPNHHHNHHHHPNPHHHLTLITILTFTILASLSP